MYHCRVPTANVEGNRRAALTRAEDQGVCRQVRLTVRLGGAASRGKRLVKEFPGIGSIEAPDDYRLQERWFEIA